MTEYRTLQGDTWDVIAYKVYGSCYCLDALLAANRDYVDTTIFKSGVKLIVPDLIEKTKENSPPWRR